MTNQEIKETLEKQLQLLSERSFSGLYQDADDLCNLSAAMLRIAVILASIDTSAFTPLP